MALPRSLMRTPTGSNAWQKASPGKYNQAPKPSAGASSTSLPPPAAPHKGKLKGDEEPGEVKEYGGVHRRCHPGDPPCKDQEEMHNDSEHSPEGPTELPIHPLHSWKDTCNEEQLAEIRVKCQQLIQQCVSGLVLNLTIEQVKDVEGALHRAVCWYLTCERYWEAGAIDPPEFPWGIVTVFILLLTLGVSICYYIVWVLCESSHDSNTSTPLTSDPPQRIPQVSTVSPVSVPAVSQPATASTSLMATSSSSRGNSLGRTAASDSRAKFCAAESESECRDSGFNEGGLYPDYDPPDNHSDAHSYRSRHYSEDSRLSLPPEDPNQRFYVHEERVYNYASTFTPNYEQRRLRRNRYNYLDDFDAYSEIEGDGMDGSDGAGGLSRERSDSFIYVSYPPEVKKRFTENR